jgi:nucleotide-binding universal stress UspA family protein
MFTRILVPVDGTPESSVALSPARTLATALGAEIVLTRVVPTRESTLSVLNSPEVTRAHEYLEALAATLRTSNVQVTVVVSRGGPAETIVGEAHARGADLIVMATRAQSGQARLTLGGVAERVLTHARVPVVFVRANEHRPGNGEEPAGGVGRGVAVGENPRMERLKLILVPVDGSDGSLVALGAAAQLARAARAAVVLLQVTVPLPLWIYDPTLGLNTGPLIDPRWDEDRRANAEAYVRQVAQRLVDAGVEAGADAVLGEVAPAIAELRRPGGGRPDRHEHARAYGSGQSAAGQRGGAGRAYRERASPPAPARVRACDRGAWWCHGTRIPAFTLAAGRVPGRAPRLG